MSGRQKTQGTCVVNGKLYHGTTFKTSGWDVWVDGKKMEDEDGEIVDLEAHQRYLRLRNVTEYDDNEEKKNNPRYIKNYNAIEAGDIQENFDGVDERIVEMYLTNKEKKDNTAQS